MKILKREDFLDLPEGTVFAKGKKWNFFALHIKGKTVGRMFYYFDPCWIKAQSTQQALNRLEDMLADPTISYDIDDCFLRDDGIDADVFMIFERKDLLQLRNYILLAIVNTQP